MDLSSVGAVAPEGLLRRRPGRPGASPAGYEPGFRASWQSALGAAPDEAVIQDNDSFWSGDHLVDPAAVPGSFFSNRKIHSLAPTLIDVAPTVLESLGIEPLAEMDGRSLF